MDTKVQHQIRAAVWPLAKAFAAKTAVVNAKSEHSFTDGPVVQALTDAGLPTDEGTLAEAREGLRECLARLGRGQVEQCAPMPTIDMAAMVAAAHQYELAYRAHSRAYQALKCSVGATTPDVLLLSDWGYDRETPEAKACTAAALDLMHAADRMQRVARGYVPTEGEDW